MKTDFKVLFHQSLIIRVNNQITIFANIRRNVYFKKVVFHIKTLECIE